MVITTENEHLLRELKGIIYVIRNKINNKCYVGQTRNSFRKRYGTNFKKMSNGYLKNSIKKYGIKNFEISIVESNLDHYELDKKECEWSLQLNCYFPNGYNLKPCGESAKKYTEEFNKIMSETSGNIKEWTFKNIKTGEILKIKNLEKFCKNNKLCRVSLTNAINQRGLTYKNTYCSIDTTIGMIKDKMFHSRYSNLNPPYKIYKRGKEIIFSCINDFCKQNKIKSNKIVELLNNKIKFYRDYTLNKEDYYPAPDSKKYEYIELKDKDGNLFKFDNIVKFCKEKNLTFSSIYYVITGKYKQSNGYTLNSVKISDYYLQQLPKPAPDLVVESSVPL